MTTQSSGDIAVIVCLVGKQLSKNFAASVRNMKFVNAFIGVDPCKASGAPASVQVCRYVTSFSEGTEPDSEQAQQSRMNRITSGIPHVFRMP